MEVRGLNISEKQLTLYAVTDRRWLQNGQTLAGQVEQAILGGVTVVQLREKHAGAAEFLALAQDVKQVTDRYQVPLIINDNLEVALAVDAAGIHVGQADLAAAAVRQTMGNKKVVGVSAQTVEQALAAEQAGADYLGVGAVFPTSSKADAVEVDFATLQAICRAVQIPVVAIGRHHCRKYDGPAGLRHCGRGSHFRYLRQAGRKKSSAGLGRQMEKPARRLLNLPAKTAWQQKKYGTLYQQEKIDEWAICPPIYFGQ